jgi:hypothetical protein
MAIFAPISVGSTIPLAVTATAASVTIPSGPGSQLLVQNAGGNTAWWLTGVNSATATAVTGTSTPILAGAIMLYTIAPDATQFSAISATGTTPTLYITKCAGT